MAKIIKNYKLFLESQSYDSRFKFEEIVIDPIISIIRDNQEYLTQAENLPQLAKLGFIYNKLWYDGRVCWGYDGILLDKKIKKEIDNDETLYSFISCEENPKYKIEECNPIDDNIENLIYDAWSMHVMESEGKDNIDFSEFSKIIKDGKELSAIEKKLLKSNKTFDEWVEIKTDPEYEYSDLYEDRKSVASSLLCTLGGGYGWNNDGFIIEEAGGADQDKSIYGDWKNAKFRKDIEEIVFNIIDIPEVELTVDSAKTHISELKNKREEERNNRLKTDDPELDAKIKEILANMDFSKIRKNLKQEEEKPKKKYKQYYPISSSSNIYPLADKETQNRIGISKFDQSYIDAAKEVCVDILENQGQEREGNVEFAIKFMAFYGDEKYLKMIPKEFDKYALLNEIKEYFASLVDDKDEIKGQVTSNNYGTSTYQIRLNDTATSQYADNNYYINIFFSKSEQSSLPKISSNNPEIMKGTKYYDDLLEGIDRLNNNTDVKYISFNYDAEIGELSMVIHVNPKTVKYAKEEDESSNNFSKQGFIVGKNSLKLTLDKLGVSLIIRKPKPLGSSHPNNKSGKEYFSNVLTMNVVDLKNSKLFALHIDERGYNTCYKESTVGGGVPSRDNDLLSGWMINEYNKMKSDDKTYGEYDSSSRKGREGRSLYAHDFMICLKEHQDEFKNYE